MSLIVHNRKGMRAVTARKRGSNKSLRYRTYTYGISVSSNKTKLQLVIKFLIPPSYPKAILLGLIPYSICQMTQIIPLHAYCCDRQEGAKSSKFKRRVSRHEKLH